MSEPLRSGFAALVGWTNVGKSTLLNRLVGEKIAAVAEVPHTTRHRIAGVITLRDRGQIVLVDTPGFHRPEKKLHRAMLETARRALQGSDLVVLVVDAAHGIGSGDAQVAREIVASKHPAIAVLNKIDLVRPKSKLLPMMGVVGRDWGLDEAVPVSGRTGEGCDSLVERILARLPVGPAPFPEDWITDQPERAIVAEWIREPLLSATREEIPHAVAVRIERWEERDDGLISIGAVVLVERESQKGIVIGRGGAMLKRVGSEARQAIETLLGAHVFLEIRVEVRREWRDDARALKDLGLS